MGPNLYYLEMVRQGAELWNQWRVDSKVTGFELAGADVSDFNLSGYQLAGVDLCEGYCQLKPDLTDWTCGTHSVIPDKSMDSLQVNCVLRVEFSLS